MKTVSTLLQRPVGTALRVLREAGHQVDADFLAHPARATNTPHRNTPHIADAEPSDGPPLSGWRRGVVSLTPQSGVARNCVPTPLNAPQVLAETHFQDLSLELNTPVGQWGIGG